MINLTELLAILTLMLVCAKAGYQLAKDMQKK